jgi:hypothetical protein
MNRTDEGVAALTRWLSDRDPKIRDRAADAIRIAYRSRGFAQGRALRPEDFSELAKLAAHTKITKLTKITRT